MRSSKTRSRGKNNRNRNSQPGGNISNRVFDSSGPEGKVRGTPQQIIDKYNQLTRDAQLANDRVAAENFAQHAEHYTRLLAENQREMEAKREAQEAQNRERQAQRDAERAERLERQENQQKSGQQPYADDPANAPQPDVMDTQSESALVDTPETKPSKPQNRRPRKPRNPKPVDQAAQGEQPEAAEVQKEPAPKKPRARKSKPAEPEAAPEVQAASED
ncbi:DUF4167 domain-containing protein [Halocynthiibacter sp. C4]|uniref:DUF4167 domain-containing protein n=1 Tax=Halocynthiibacter sp. C4 TaxID=2992758 RepID=UPI00237AE356|nr:DUF4167 domain-containing protein [Halocynthiibacter sp. C4]MDE0589350.1 DUF4167 domain-containing protein [Halocynthiibacter sp. C4]